MKLCFSTLGCPGWSIVQVAENAAAYGYDGVELRIHGDRHVDPALTKKERHHVKDLFVSHGISIPTIAGYTTFCGDDTARLTSNKEALLRNAELAADLGAPYLRTVMGTDGEFTSRGEEVLRTACNAAYEMGVTVVLEIHGSIKSGKLMSKVLGAVNSPSLGVLWDIHHSVAAGEPPEDTWQYVGQHVRHMHIKDATADNSLVLMGVGVLPVAEVVKTALKNGYKGFFSFEWEKTWVPSLEEPEIALPQYVSYMRGLCM